MNPILPLDLSPEELKSRLVSMRNYRQWALVHSPKTVLSEPELRSWLERSRYEVEKNLKVVLGS